MIGNGSVGLISTTTSRFSISCFMKATVSCSTSSIRQGWRSGAVGRMAFRNWLMIILNRSTSLRDILTKFSMFLRLSAGRVGISRASSCRWIWRELRGLPISCATPAASRVRAFRRSDLRTRISFSRSEVTSRKITTKPLDLPALSAIGIIYMLIKRFSG